MAWLDDRIWCHPKFTSLPASAAWVYVKGVAYSSGMSTGGVLNVGVQKMIGCSASTRRTLVLAGLWDQNRTGETVRIHDWDEHNARRDERRRKDRERKRAERRKA
jgi:hypothetical protein